MTKKEKLQKDDERLDQELIEVLTKISIVSGRMARNIEKYSRQRSKEMELERLNRERITH